MDFSMSDGDMDSDDEDGFELKPDDTPPKEAAVEPRYPKVHFAPSPTPSVS